MGERSLFANVMLFVIAAILAIGFYLTIGAIDIFRQREEVLVTEVRTMRSEIGRLRESLEGGGFAVGARPGSTTQGAPSTFANADLRDPNAVDGDAIVMAMQSETGNLNYIINNEASVGDFWEMANDSVAERSYKQPDLWQPKLAERWEISEDKLTYTIYLRKGVMWHDFTDPTTGEKFQNVEVTAEDFKFFIDVMRNPKIPCEPLRGYFMDLDGLTVIDSHTFKVTWKRLYWMSQELTLGLSPLPRHFYRFDPDKAEQFTDNTERNRMIVGCGPWVFERWDKGSMISFRRNERYYGPKPHLKRRVVKVIKEPTARLQALRNGELDRIGLLPEQWTNQTGDAAFADKFVKLRYPNRSYSYIGYNMQRDMFKDRRVRVALTHLVNRERILREVYYGQGTIITGPFYKESPSYDPDVTPWPFDIAKARALLAEAGWRDTNNDGVLDKDGRRFQFTFMTISGHKIGEQIADIVREDFAKAGIVVTINPVEWSIYTERLDVKNYDVCSLGWGMGWEQDPFQIWHSSQADVEKGSNHVSFRNAEADRIIEQARAEFDKEKRTEIYRQFHRLLHEEQPYTFLITPEALVAQDKRFQNAQIYPLGMNINTFWVPADQQKYGD